MILGDLVRGQHISLPAQNHCLQTHTSSRCLSLRLNYLWSMRFRATAATAIICWWHAGVLRPAPCVKAEGCATSQASTEIVSAKAEVSVSSTTAIIKHGTHQMAKPAALAMGQPSAGRVMGSTHHMPELAVVVMTLLNVIDNDGVGDIECFPTGSSACSR